MTEPTGVNTNTQTLIHTYAQTYAYAVYLRCHTLLQNLIIEWFLLPRFNIPSNLAASITVRHSHSEWQLG